MEQQDKILQAAIAANQLFDRVDFKGSELQAAMAVKGLLEGIANGNLQVVPNEQPPQEGSGSINPNTPAGPAAGNSFP